MLEYLSINNHSNVRIFEGEDIRPNVSGETHRSFGEGVVD